MKLDKKRFDQVTALATRREEAQNILNYLRDMNSFDMTLGSRRTVFVYGSLKDSLAVGIRVEIDKIDNELHALDVDLKEAV